MQVQTGTPQFAAYCAMRAQLWQIVESENLVEAHEILALPSWGVFVAQGSEDTPLGFVEAHLRDYAEGASSSPVGYLEGWYVVPIAEKGLAQCWSTPQSNGRSRGCIDKSSDTTLENSASIQAHERLGYHEVERQICFLKRL